MLARLIDRTVPVVLPSLSNSPSTAMPALKKMQPTAATRPTTVTPAHMPTMRPNAFSSALRPLSGANARTSAPRPTPAQARKQATNRQAMRISPRITPQMTRLTRPERVNTTAAPTSPMLAVPCCWLTVTTAWLAAFRSAVFCWVLACQSPSVRMSNLRTMSLTSPLNRSSLILTLSPFASPTV